MSLYGFGEKTKAIAEAVGALPADATNPWRAPIVAAPFVEVAFWIDASDETGERIVYFCSRVGDEANTYATIEPLSRRLAKTVLDTNRIPMLIPFYFPTLDRLDFCIGMLKNEAKGARIEVLKGLRT